jgi:hypothetical protein
MAWSKPNSFQVSGGDLSFASSRLGSAPLLGLLLVLAALTRYQVDAMETVGNPGLNWAALETYVSGLRGCRLVLPAPVYPR